MIYPADSAIHVLNNGGLGVGGGGGGRGGDHLEYSKWGNPALVKV